jgi:Methyl-accepting chemotaxis protein-like, first PDC sensor domain
LRSGSYLAAAADASRLLAALNRRVEEVLASVTKVRDAALGLLQAAGAAGRPVRTADLEPLRPLAARVLAAHQGFIAGAGVVLTPGILADAARCLEWWWSTPGGEVSKLAVDLDPDSPECYDYTTTQWYREPGHTGQPAVTGPYVDYICTREYTFTVSVPLLSGGRFAGIAGADILADEVERLALPALARLPRPAALVSGNGRVIASNTTRALPGSVLGGEHVWQAPSLPWSLRTAG